MSESVFIKQLSEHEFNQWDQYVDSHKDSTFFHRAGWVAALQTGLKHAAHYLYAMENERIVGVLPLIHTKSRLFGNKLSSCVFCASGGALADSELIEQKLLSEANQLAHRLKVDVLEVRSKKPLGSSWITNSLYVNFANGITDDDEKNMLAIPRKQRAMVRKGIKKELRSEETRDLERFYAIYSESVRNLGTPVFAKRYFSVLQNTFGQDCRMLMIVHEGRDIASVMSFYHKDTVLPYYGGSISAARSLQGNDFMYWELMRLSAAEGLKRFDYGRSKLGSGSYNFKKNWGFEPEQLHYEYKLVKADRIPEVNPNNKKYSFFIDKWKKLPLPVANALGPHISRTLG